MRSWAGLDQLSEVKGAGVEASERDSPALLLLRLQREEGECSAHNY